MMLYSLFWCFAGTDEVTIFNSFWRLLGQIDQLDHLPQMRMDHLPQKLITKLFSM